MTSDAGDRLVRCLSGVPRRKHIIVDTLDHVLLDDRNVFVCSRVVDCLHTVSGHHVENAIAVMWGAEDLFAVTGGTATRWPDGRYRDVAVHVRSQTLLAAKAYGRLALDSVYLDIKDLDGLRAEVDDAVEVTAIATADEAQQPHRQEEEPAFGERKHNGRKADIVSENLHAVSPKPNLSPSAFPLPRARPVPIPQ